MSMLAGMFLLPAAYLVGLVHLARKGDRRGLGISLLFFLVSVAVGFWAITRSRSSTAGIGILFLPLLGAIAGGLALGFAYWRSSPETGARIAGWLCLGGAVLVVGSQLVQGERTIERNRARDDKQAAHERDIARERRALADTLRENAGQESEVVDRLIRARMNDRAFMIPALESEFVSPDVLDSAARSTDMGVVLQALRNPNTPGETLARVYREASYPDYYFQTLAAHANTPPAILRAIYERPRTIGGLDIWFAGNAATPRDILDRISRTTRDVNVIQKLLQNPTLDCALLNQTASSLGASDRPADEYSLVTVGERRAELCR